MILALLPGPLTEFFGPNRFLRAWLAIRRNLGVAAFAYAALHLAAYVIDMQALSAMLAELGLPGIWTGWLALAMMAVPAAISTDRAVRRFGRRWKLLQRLVYPALLLALIHWTLLDRAWGPALVHLAPLGLAWAMRLAARNGYRFGRKFARLVRLSPAPPRLPACSPSPRPRLPTATSNAVRVRRKNGRRSTN